MSYIDQPNRCDKRPFRPSRAQIAIAFVAVFIIVFALESAVLAVIGAIR